MKEGEELAAGPEHRHRDLKGCYNSISSAAASELGFFPSFGARVETMHL